MNKVKIITIIILFCVSNLVYAQIEKDSQFQRKGFIIGTMVSKRMSVILLGGASSIYDYNGIGRARKRGFEGIFVATQILDK